jgi:hypothetical protein
LECLASALISSGYFLQIESWKGSGLNSPEKQMLPQQKQDEICTAYQHLAYRVHGTVPSQQEVAAALRDTDADCQSLQSEGLDVEDNVMAQLVAATLQIITEREHITGDRGNLADNPSQRHCPKQSLTPLDEFLCPIGLKLMTDPVMLVESGQVFSRDNITVYLARGNRVCPITGMPTHCHSKMCVSEN